ncbi:MAG: DarT ssDNA thymidine ADP-ribosyltransferase family protein [Bryobacteraceae bacterium]
MSTPADPLLAITKLYHFTDVRNLPLIKKLDGLWATAKLRKGNTEFFPGGNQWSLDQDVNTGVDYYVHLCWDRNHHMEKNIRERDKDIKLFYLEIDRLILYEPGVLFTPDVANGKNVPRHTVPEAVAGEMIDYDALNRKIGSLGESTNQMRRQKAERTEILVPERVAMKWITNFPHG